MVQECSGLLPCGTIVSSQYLSELFFGFHTVSGAVQLSVGDPALHNVFEVPACSAAFCFSCGRGTSSGGHGIELPDKVLVLFFGAGGIEFSGIEFTREFVESGAPVVKFINFSLFLFMNDIESVIARGFEFSVKVLIIFSGVWYFAPLAVEILSVAFQVRRFRVKSGSCFDQGVFPGGSIADCCLAFTEEAVAGGEEVVAYRLELLNCLADAVHRHTHADAHGHCCHDVLIVMLAQKLHIRFYIEHFLFLAVMRIDHGIAI